MNGEFGGYDGGKSDVAVQCEGTVNGEFGGYDGEKCDVAVQCEGTVNSEAVNGEFGGYDGGKSDAAVQCEGNVNYSEAVNGEFGGYDGGKSDVAVQCEGTLNSDALNENLGGYNGGKSDAAVQCEDTVNSETVNGEFDVYDRRGFAVDRSSEDMRNSHKGIDQAVEQKTGDRLGIGDDGHVEPSADSSTPHKQLKVVKRRRRVDDETSKTTRLISDSDPTCLDAADEIVADGWREARQSRQLCNNSQ